MSTMPDNPAPGPEPSAEATGEAAAAPGQAPLSLAPKLYAMRELTIGAQNAAAFWRALARSLKTCRLYKGDNPIVIAARESVFKLMNEALAAYGTWQFRITPYEIFLLDEPVVRPTPAKPHVDVIPQPEEKLPFLFYRDGIRGITIAPDVPLSDFEALFGALLSVGTGLTTQDDLVTLLWQANTNKLRIETVPFSQTIYLHSRRPGADAASGGHQGQSFAWSPNGSEIRADLGQMVGGPSGLHRDTFDDWPLPRTFVEVPEAYEKMMKGMQFVRSKLLFEWSAESTNDWQMDAQVLLEKVLEIDPEVRTRANLAHCVMNWLVSAIQDSKWDEAQQAFGLLRQFDPDGSLTNGLLADAMAGLDTEDITERLDESQSDDQAKFFALTVAMGRPAVDFACAVMAKSEKSRTRAAACTMLCYLCSGQPELLAPYLKDGRWYVARNAVFILGQIGGPEVVSLLEQASHHQEPRVRRAVVQALGNCPGPERVPLLLAQLDTRDPQLLAATLNMLGRYRSPIAARAILRQVESPGFYARAEENQRSLFNALAELGDDEIVPNLEVLLHKGGWFARPSLERTAAARTLQRIGTDAAHAALEAGLSSRSEAVRHACMDAMNMRGQ